MCVDTPSLSPVSAAHQRVRSLLDQLKKELDNENMSEKEQLYALEQLKVLGRNVDFAGPIFTDEGIQILSQFAFDQNSIEVSREALRCLANALLLDSPSRLRLVKLDRLPDVVKTIARNSAVDDYLGFRILFCASYEPSADFDILVTKHNLVKVVEQTLSRFRLSYDFTQELKHSATQMPVMALVECLKSIYTLSCTREMTSQFESIISPIIDLLVSFQLPDQQPLQPAYPISHIINLAMSLTGGCELKDTTKAELTIPLAVRLIDILDNVLPKSEKSTNLDGIKNYLTMLFGLISNIYDASVTDVQDKLRSGFLPSEEERQLPLGKSDSVVSRILNLTTIPSLKNAADAGMHMLFIISGSDAAKYVDNVGYGFASGYMAQNGIPFPTDRASGGRDDGPMVNPITGQLFSAEDAQGVKLPPMTREEKEREAEKMFVLFERMRATGVMDVHNPIQEAVDSGRFQEIPDSSSDDDSDDSDDKEGKASK